MTSPDTEKGTALVTGQGGSCSPRALLVTRRGTGRADGQGFCSPQAVLTFTKVFQDPVLLQQPCWFSPLQTVPVIGPM